jgi:hypothetical protein
MVKIRQHRRGVKRELLGYVEIPVPPNLGNEKKRFSRPNIYENTYYIHHYQFQIPKMGNFMKIFIIFLYRDYSRKRLNLIRVLSKDIFYFSLGSNFRKTTVL